MDQKYWHIVTCIIRTIKNRIAAKAGTLASMPLKESYDGIDAMLYSMCLYSRET